MDIERFAGAPQSCVWTSKRPFIQEEEKSFVGIRLGLMGAKAVDVPSLSDDQ